MMYLPCALSPIVTLIDNFEDWEIAKHRASVHTAQGNRTPLVATTWFVPIAGLVNRDSTRAVIVGHRLFGWLFTYVTFLHTIDNGVHSIDAVADPGS